ncbi:MAG: AhpC/TSA family protein [Flavobacteriales bacterium]|nr:AhpC/TSA family protein [Flavobacteriales bacterium]
MKKQHYLMNFTIAAIMTTFTMMSCENAPAKNESGTETPDSLKVPVFVNGVNDANRGSKTGSVEVKGQMAAFKQGKVYLWESTGRLTNKIDSATIANNAFSFGSKQYESGIYMIGTADNNLCPIIINPSEPVCEVGFKAGNMEAGLYSIQSKENEAWAKYLTKETALLKAIKDARVAGAKSPSLKIQYDQQAAAKEYELWQLQKQLIEEYPGTFAAKILTWKQEPNKSDIRQYWSNIDFSDESIIRTKVLTDRIENFMRGFSKGEESGFINCIATVAENAKANDKVLEFSLNQMLTGFYESNMENICAYIIDNYVNGDACGDADLSNVIKSTAESIQNLSIGKTPPNFVLDEYKGGKYDLYANVAKNKYTLIMFWSSWCEHCKGEAPEVKKCYEDWHGKGFDIVGVSIDRNKLPWQEAIKTRGFFFPNVCGMKEYQSPVAKDYRVTRTPAFFLLDSEKHIVLKPKGIKEVQAFLAKNLK